MAALPHADMPVTQLLVALQLSDSAFPSGRYTMSHGLEAFCQTGMVDPATVGQLLEDVLVSSVGPGDATALACAHTAASRGDWAGVTAIDEALYASKLNAELRAASTRCGRQSADVAAEAYRDGTGSEQIAAWSRRVKARSTPGCQPIVTAVCFAATGVSAKQAVAADLFAFSTSYVGAALRLRLVDHRGAQLLLRRTHPAIAATTAAALTGSVSDIGGFVPVGDIMSAVHERAEARMFAS